MWKKSEPEEVEREVPKTSTVVSPVDRTEVRKGTNRATIGPSIHVHGDVTGEEDLLVQGRVEGKIDLKQHSVTVGPNGQVKADVYGRTIVVEGELEGSLFGGEQVVLRQSARVRGNIVSPRVTLEDGAIFKGNIDMEVKSSVRATVGPTAVPSPQPSAPSAGPKAVAASAEPRPEESKKAVRIG